MKRLSYIQDARCLKVKCGFGVEEQMELGDLTDVLIRDVITSRV